MNIAFITKTPDFEIDFVSIVAFHIAQKNPSATCYLYYSNPLAQIDAETIPKNLICSQKASRKKTIHFLENWKQQRHFKNLLRQQHTDFLFCNGYDEIVEGGWKKIVFEGEIQSNKISKKQLNSADAIVHYQGSKPDVLNEKNIAIQPLVFQKNSNQKKENSTINLVEHDFFLLSTDDLEQAVVFLKAYSQFKQWQKSNIRVLVHLPKAIRMLFHQKISNYAYREAIVMLEDGEQYQWATSHCFGHFVWQEKEIVNEAIKRGLLSNKPIFTTAEKSNQLMFEDCLGFFEKTEKSIFSSMTQLYKETLPVKDWAENRKKFYANDATHFTLVEMEKLMQA